MGFLKFITLNFVDISEKKSRRAWNNNEKATIINAIELRNGRPVNIGYLAKLLNRSISSVRNKVLEFADKLQDFGLKTTVREHSGEDYGEFVARVQNPKRRPRLIILFRRFKMPVFNSFWRFNKGELI